MRLPGATATLSKARIVWDKVLFKNQAVCRELVERMDGEIWAESEPGRGSKFIFTLPSGADELPGG